MFIMPVLICIPKSSINSYSFFLILITFLYLSGKSPCWEEYAWSSCSERASWEKCIYSNQVQVIAYLLVYAYSPNYLVLNWMQRLAKALDADIKRWSSGKEGNLRALLSTLQYVCPCIISMLFLLFSKWYHFTLFGKTKFMGRH